MSADQAERMAAAQPSASPIDPARLADPGHDDGIDDPYQCAFCGRPTEPADRRCPHCGQSLLLVQRASLAPGPSLRTAIFLLLILFTAGVLEIGPALFSRVVAQGADPSPYQLLLRTPGAALFVGPFLDWPGRVATTLLAIAIGRSAFLLVCAVLLRLRAPLGYYLTVGGLALDVLWAIYRIAGAYIGPAGAVGNLALDLVILAMLFASDRDFAVVRRRLLVQPDGGLRGGLSFHRRGHEYRRHGMWALAVAHWRMAVGAAPREVQYYKDLGAGYAQIGRFDRALRALEEAARQDPKDHEIARMIELVGQQREGVR